MSIDCTNDSLTKSNLDYSEQGPSEMPEPTSAPIGSPEKVEVLRKRVELGQVLWHPLDSKELWVGDAWFKTKNPR